MPILTIELPEDIAAHVDAMPSQDRAELDYKLRELTVAFATAHNSPRQNETIVDLRDRPTAIADEDAARIYDGHAVYAEMRERFGWKQR